MKITKRITMLGLLFICTSFIAKAQESTATLEFENATIAENLVKNYTAALQNGDVNKMNAQLHENAMVYGLGGGLDSLNVKQHTDYFTRSMNQYKHSISGDLYLPVKVENNWNEGEWLLSWGTNTITDKKTGNVIEVPYHTVSMVDNGKIVFIRYFYDMLNIVTNQGYTVVPPKK